MPRMCGNPKKKPHNKLARGIHSFFCDPKSLFAQKTEWVSGEHKKRRIKSPTTTKCGHKNGKPKCAHNNKLVFYMNNDPNPNIYNHNIKLRTTSISLPFSPFPTRPAPLRLISTIWTFCVRRASSSGICDVFFSASSKLLLLFMEDSLLWKSSSVDNASCGWRLRDVGIFVDDDEVVLAADSNNRQCCFLGNTRRLEEKQKQQLAAIRKKKQRF